MKITKIDPQQGDESKSRNRALSNSQQKSKNMLIKKKYEQSFFNDKNILITKPLKLSREPDNRENQTISQDKVDFNEKNQNSKIKLTQLYAKDQRQTLLSFIEAQIKNDRINDDEKPTHSSKSSLKLPLINNPKYQLQNDIQDQHRVYNITEMQSYHKNLGQNTSSNSNYQKFISYSPSTQKDINRQLKQNGIFMNIKAVVPIQKSSTSKRKDYSLRDLRILKKQKYDNDHVVQDLNTINQSIAKLNANTGFTKIQRLSQKQFNNSPIKLRTSDKKRSQINSVEKIQSAGFRQKKTFSINQGKKKYASTFNDFSLFISSLNKIRLSNQSIVNVSYKAFVSKGNNSILIKNVIKNRFWWNIVTQRNQNDINFLWQQSRCPIFLNSLASTKIDSSNQNSQKDIKKIKMHLQNKNEQKQNENIKEFIKVGFMKLLSEKQAQQSSSTSYYTQIPNSDNFSAQNTLDPSKIKIHNHLQFNAHLTNKKALFYNLKTYYEMIKQDPFKSIPLTYHVKQHGDESWNQFKQVFDEKFKDYQTSKIQSKKKKKDKQRLSAPLWIIKPGENSNQGCGIQVSDNLEEIAEIVRQKTTTGKNRSSIVQRYLMPFLYCKRKFDIRCYLLATSIKGIFKGYWYEEGYIRTSCKQFTTKNLKNRMIHLTNDAVQKKSEDYGKYQTANKLSFNDFQKYLDNGQKKLNFYKSIYPQMMKLAKDALSATYLMLDSHNKEFTFEIFGLDFMIDQEFNTWLIQVNNNPCLELCGPLQARIIPNMIQNAFKIAIDPLFPPPSTIPRSKCLPSDLFESNKFSLIFNSNDVGQTIRQNILNQNKLNNLSKIIQGQDSSQQFSQQQQGKQQQPNQILYSSKTLHIRSN